jgi:hypothetical protein
LSSNLLFWLFRLDYKMEASRFDFLNTNTIGAFPFNLREKQNTFTPACAGVTVPEFGGACCLVRGRAIKNPWRTTGF